MQAIVLPREINSRATELLMPRGADWFDPTRFGVVCFMLAAAAVSFDRPARADCILQPTQQAPEGAHWTVHLDRVQNRRCWILVDATGHEVSMPQPQPAPSTGLSSLQTFLDKLTRGFPASPPPPPSPEPPAGPAAAPQPRKPQARVSDPNGAKRNLRTEHRSSGRTTKRKMTPPERDALFAEFLRWRERQQIGTANPPASR